MEALTDSTGASLEESSKEIVRQAAEAVGSLTSSEFNVSFNPDIFQPHVRHAPSYDNDLKADKQVVKDAAKFLLTNQIPFFVSCFSLFYISGCHTVEKLHNWSLK